MHEQSPPVGLGPQPTFSHQLGTGLEEMMKAAAGFEAQGRAEEAEQRYREIVEWRPDCAPAWAALGYHAFRKGNLVDAVQFTERCVALHPASPLNWRNLCEFRRRAGETADAITAGRRAVDLDPADPESYHNLSLALGDANQIPEAIAVVQRLIEIAPEHGRGWNNLGYWLLKIGRQEDARRAFQRAVTLDPNDGDARLNLTNIDEILERSSRVRASFVKERSLAVQESFADLMKAARRLWAEGRQQQALAFLHEALALEPENFETLGLLATCLADLGKAEAAIAEAERALAIDPKNPAILMTLALCQLSLGRWKEGWENYESRFDGSDEVMSGKQVFSKIPVPQWKGATGTEHQAILIVHEQGYGDTLQFCRYLSLLRERFARVGFLAPPALLRLMDSTFGAEIAILSGSSADYTGWDWHCMLMSLPFAFQTDIDTVPQAPSYLRVPEPARDYWRIRLSHFTRAGLKIGLSWTGRPDHRFNRDRTISFEALQPLLAIEGVTFISLQQDGGAAAIAPPGARWVDWMAEMTDFLPTAALVANLDLVIGVDSVIVHLAGALGTPVWLLNRFNSEWRWMSHREESPWYPSMRIFRQSVMGEWSDVVARVAAEICALRDARLSAVGST